MVYRISAVIIFFLTSFSPIEKITEKKVFASTTVSTFETEATTVYRSLNANNFSLPDMESFAQGLQGFYELKAKGVIKKDILTLIDFSKSSNTKRLWVIDLSTNTILFHSLVAHGRNSGEEFANAFSNAAESYKSSLGLYVTGEIYNGKHGSSLKLDGMEKGVNSSARARGVVMHAADYVSESFIKNNHRLGRSQGCPALPNELTQEIIQIIKNKSCLFIYHPSHATVDAKVLMS
jgi:L,D-transpeptidase-like protein